MRYLISVIYCFFLCFSIYSCKAKTLYVPVESVKTEYVDRYHRDSLYRHDSIIITKKNDTMWLEKYLYIYRDKLVHDSVYVNDSIQVPYPVVEYVDVNKLSGFQNFLIWCGGISLLIALFLILYRVLKKKFKGILR